MRVIFFGTPALSAEVLRVLIESDHQIVAVVTQADKPQGRNQHMSISPVKKLSQERLAGVPVFQPVKARDPEFIESLRAFNADVFVVAAYGQILPQALLDIPLVDCINVHYSLLPLLRGAAPIQRSILEGHSETGVSIMKMVLAMDAGPVYSMKKIMLDDQVTSGQLSERLTAIAGPQLLEVMTDLALNKAILQEQDVSKMTLAPKIETASARVDWKQSSHQLQFLIRAMDPAPGAWCEVEIRGLSKRIKLFEPKVVEVIDSLTHNPGAIVCYGKRLVVACGFGALEIGKIQPEGKPVMTANAWCNGQELTSVKFKLI